MIQPILLSLGIGGIVFFRLLAEKLDLGLERLDHLVIGAVSLAFLGQSRFKLLDHGEGIVRIVLVAAKLALPLEILAGPH